MTSYFRSIVSSKQIISSCRNGKTIQVYSRRYHSYSVHQNSSWQLICRKRTSSIKWYSTKVKPLPVETDDDINGGKNKTNQLVTKVINVKLPARKSRNKHKPKNVEEKYNINVYSDTNTKLKWVKVQPDGYTLEVDFQDIVKTVEVEQTNDSKSVLVEFPEKSEIIQINLDPVHKLLDETNPSKNIESIKDLAWVETTLDISKLPQYYMNLSKIRLTGLVVLTTMAGYAMAPTSFSLAGFLLCSSGTALTSCAANAMNQYFEVPFDSQMNRTKNRVLVKGLLSPLHAVTFSVITSTVGLTVLYFGVNPLTATLGAFNLGLYTLVYTPMKRYSIANTWVGSIVGGIPPVMGWTAATGCLDSGALLLGAILYAWQFPHFNSLSWNLRPDYSRGGYRMASVINPELCKRVALRHSIGMTGLCLLPPMMGMTTWLFAIDSLPLNLYLTYLSWNFYRKGDSNSSRKLFRFTLIHIPLLMVLMIASKNYNEYSKRDKKPGVVEERT